MKEGQYSTLEKILKFHLFQQEFKTFDMYG